MGRGGIRWGGIGVRWGRGNVSRDGVGWGGVWVGVFMSGCECDLGVQEVADFGRGEGG